MDSDKWQGEDEVSDSEVKLNWDDESEEEETPEPVVIPKKKTTKEKIAEREEKERLKREEKLREKELRNKKLTPEEQLALRLEQQKMEEESDLRLAMDSFGGSSKSTNINLDEYTLATKEDFEKFRSNLVNKLSAVSSEPYYASFLEDLFRELCVPVETEDLKKISSSLTALYNEKLKAQRNANSKKKKGKGTSIKMEKNTNMIAQDYGDEVYDDDLDDFM